MSVDLNVVEPSKSAEPWQVSQVIGNGWRAVHTVQPAGGGQATYAGYRVEPEVPDAGLPSQPPTARQQRGIATGDAVLRAVLRRMQSSGAHQVMAAMAGFVVPPPPQPRRYPDLFYAQWAAAYLQAWRQGRGAIAQLARERGIHRTSHLYEILAVARKRGLLTEAPRGKGGGHLTDKAQKLLKESDRVHSRT